MVVVTDYAVAAASERANAALAAATRARIAREEGGIAGFHSRLRVAPIVQPDELPAFYAVLESSILADELVPLEDFVAAIGPKNADAAMQRALGPYRYVALAVRTDDAGTIGAAGFAVFCHRAGAASVHASYYALLARFRGLGLGRLMLHAVCRSAIGFIAEARPAALRAGPVVQFIEANDIASMTLGDRLQDQAIALHPLARDALWERLGFREIVNIHYRQRSDVPIGLALKALLISVDGARYDLRPPDAVAGALVRRHVRAFDNLLMNYETARKLIASGRKLPAPRPAGLLARLDPRAALSTKSPEQAARERRCWADIDARLSTRADLPLGATMQALRDSLA